MGMMKRMKDMKDMVHAAPDMIAQAQQLGAQAQQMAAAQQAAAQAQYGAQMQAGQFGGLPGTSPTGADFEPIAGVPLEEFAAVSKGVAAHNYDGTKLPEIAAARGIPAESWTEASTGWNARIQANPVIAKRFNELYREA